MIDTFGSSGTRSADVKHTPALTDRLRAVLTVLQTGPTPAVLLVQDPMSGGDSIALRLTQDDIRALILGLEKPTLQ